MGRSCWDLIFDRRDKTRQLCWVGIFEADDADDADDAVFGDTEYDYDPDNDND